MPAAKVLLVEDSRDVRNVMAEMISMLGFKVTHAADGNDAWRKLSSKEFDLVIADMGLPGITGEELLRKMRKQDINTPVVLITGVEFSPKNKRFSDLSGFAIIQKPFKIEEFKAVISSVFKTDPKIKEKQRFG